MTAAGKPAIIRRVIYFVRLVLRYRLAILAAYALITLLALLSVSRAVVSTSLGKLFLGDSPRFEAYKRRIERFGSDELLIIAFATDDLLSAVNLRRLQRVVRRLKELPAVGRVESILDRQETIGIGERDFVDSFLESVARRPAAEEEFLSSLLEDSLANGLLISPDARHSAVIIRLRESGERPVEEDIRVVEAALAAFVEEGFPEDRLHIAGAIAVVSEMIAESQFNLKRLFPIVSVVLMLAVFLMFGRLWPVIVSSSVALIGVTWTMGLSIAIEREISILMAAVPAVILIISFSDVIHLSSAYLMESESAPSKQEAILRSVADVGRACMYTSLTTFVGFFCLSLVPTPAFRHMGWILGLGVMIALFLAVTLAPILFSVMRPPRAWRSGMAGRAQQWLDRILDVTEGWSRRRPWWVLSLFGIVVTVSVVGIFGVTVETDISKRLDENNRVRRDARYFERNFVGSNVLDVYVDLDDPERLADPEFLKRVAEFEARLQALPEVDKAISLTTVVETFHRMTNKITHAGRALPASRDELQQAMLQLELFSGSLLETLVDQERRILHLILRLNTRGLRETYRVGAAAERVGREVFSGGSASQRSGVIHVEASGMSFLMGAWLNEILAGQKRGLALSVVTIALMMMVGLRSIRCGMWSMLPNLLPLLVLGGYLGLFWEVVDSDTIMIAMLAIGIGVDDTIHFLMRYRIECLRSPVRQAALRTAFHFAGRGIVMTTVILVVGFTPFLLSDYFSLHILGTLLPLVLAVALAADVLLVPAMCQVGVFRFGRAGVHGTDRDADRPRAFR